MPHGCMQPPQLAGSVAVFEQEDPHCIMPEPQVAEHMPMEQTSLPVHGLPQLPQCAGSVWRLAQLVPPSPLQSALPAAQEHLAPEQVVPMLHVVLQAPQLALSVWKFTQLVPQAFGVVPV